MGFGIPNLAGGVYALQAEPDAGDFEILLRGYSRIGVLSGCAVTAATGMHVAVLPGVVASPAPVAGGTLTIAASDPTNPRFDVVTADPTGALAVVQGTPASHPVFPAIPAGAAALGVVLVGAGVTSIAANAIIDKRVLMSAPLPPELDAGLLGARGDSVYGSTASITSGQAVVTVSDSSITAAMVGRKASIVGAKNSDGDALKGTIIAVTAPNQFTLSANAGATVSDAGYVIGDDTDALALAGDIVQILGGHGAVFFGGTIADASHTLTVPSGVLESWMAGLAIVVAGAGSGNDALVTTISAVTSSTTATLAAAAQGDVTLAACVIAGNANVPLASPTAVSPGGRGTLALGAGVYAVRDTFLDIFPTSTGGSAIGGIRLHGRGAGATTIVIADDLGGDSAINVMQRHAVPDDAIWGPFEVDHLAMAGVGFAGDAMVVWQTEDVNVHHVLFDGILGTAGQFTACSSPTIAHVRARNCGRASNGAATFVFRQNDEGGTTSGRCTDINLWDLFIEGSDDDGLYIEQAIGVYGGGVVVDGAGADRAGFMGVDLQAVDLQISVRNCAGDGVVLTSLGSAGDIRIRGSYDGNVGAAVRVIAIDPAQTFDGVVIGGTFGWQSRNGSSVVAPLDGSVRIAADAQTYDNGGFPLMPIGGHAVATVSTTPSAINCLVADAWIVQAGSTPWTISTPLYPQDGMTLTIMLKNTSGGAITVTWPANFQWLSGATPSPPASTKVNIYRLIYVASLDVWREVSITQDVR